MPLFRRPEEEPTISETGEYEVPDINIKYEIELKAYANGEWNWRVHGPDSLMAIDYGREKSRTEALTKAQNVATHHAKGNQVIIEEKLNFTVVLKGTLE